MVINFKKGDHKCAALQKKGCYSRDQRSAFAPVRRLFKKKGNDEGVSSKNQRLCSKERKEFSG